jgi:hypothetical protein
MLRGLPPYRLALGVEADERPDNRQRPAKAYFLIRAKMRAVAITIIR